jgi:hypothetical protein
MTRTLRLEDKTDRFANLSGRLILDTAVCMAKKHKGEVSREPIKNYESLNRTPRRGVLTKYYLPTLASFRPFAFAFAFAVDVAGAVDSGSFNSS